MHRRPARRSAPKTCPMHWCSKQRRESNALAERAMTSLLMRASRGVHGPGEIQSAPLQRLDLFEGDLIVAFHQQFRPELSEILDDVVGEAVVVIDTRISRDRMLNARLVC